MQRGNDWVNQYRVTESRMFLSGGVSSVHSMNFSPILRGFEWHELLNVLLFLFLFLFPGQDWGRERGRESLPGKQS